MNNRDLCLSSSDPPLAVYHVLGLCWIDLCCEGLKGVALSGGFAAKKHQPETQQQQAALLGTDHYVVVGRRFNE